MTDYPAMRRIGENYQAPPPPGPKREIRDKSIRITHITIVVKLKEPVMVKDIKELESFRKSIILPPYEGDSVKQVNWDEV